MTEVTSIVPVIEDEKKSRAKRGGWFINDAELVELMGVPENVAYRVLQALDENRTSGFPQKIKLMNNRRYRPAVEAYFQHEYGLKVIASQHREKRYG